MWQTTRVQRSPVSLGVLGLLLLFGGATQAADVKITGLNLCCGDSDQRLTKALQGVEGLSGLDVDRRRGSVSFRISGTKPFATALSAVRSVGLYGKLAVDGQPARFPIKRVAPGTQSEKVTFVRVHLGCRAASDAVARVLRPFDEIGTITCDPLKTTVTIESRSEQQLDLARLQQALNDAGFHAELDKGAQESPAPY